MKLSKIKTMADVHKFVEAKESNKARELAWSQGTAKLAKVEAAKNASKMPEEFKINSTKSGNTTHTENNLVAIVERLDHDTTDHESRILDLEQKVIWLESCVKSLMVKKDTVVTTTDINISPSRFESFLEQIEKRKS